jgi:uncharacterized membrane protein YgcG
MMEWPSVGRYFRLVCPESAEAARSTHHRRTRGTGSLHLVDDDADRKCGSRLTLAAIAVAKADGYRFCPPGWAISNSTLSRAGLVAFLSEQKNSRLCGIPAGRPLSPPGWSEVLNQYQRCAFIIIIRSLLHSRYGVYRRIGRSYGYGSFPDSGFSGGGGGGGFSGSGGSFGGGGASGSW